MGTTIVLVVPTATKNRTRDFLITKHAYILTIFINQILMTLATAKSQCHTAPIGGISATVWHKFGTINFLTFLGVPVNHFSTSSPSRGDSPL